MEKYITGSVFCLIAAIMQSMKYVAAAIYMTGNASQSRELFQSGLTYVGGAPDIMAALALACGVLLITWGISDSFRKK